MARSFSPWTKSLGPTHWNYMHQVHLMVRMMDAQDVRMGWVQDQTPRPSPQATISRSERLTNLSVRCAES